MLTAIELEEKWHQLPEEHNTSGFRILRISPSCIPDLFVGKDTKGQRSLLLFLPEEYKLRPVHAERENISLHYHQAQHMLTISLRDPVYSELFNELIISLYHSISKLSEASVYSYRLTELLMKWMEFFEDKRENRLSQEEIRGLWGELWFLHRMMEENTISVNHILECWKGPYGHRNDFVFSDINLEVKTLEQSVGEVRISSEYQLEPEEGKAIELVVIHIYTNTTEGTSLSGLISTIRQTISERAGDIRLFLRALSQKGLGFTNVNIYNNFRFQASVLERYNSNAPGFPKLISSKLSKGLKSVKYRVRLKDVEEFLIEKKIFR